MEETVTTSVWIDAPPERVFSFLNTARDIVKATPSQDWSNYGRNENGGYRYDYTFRMAGVALQGEAEAVVCDPENKKIVVEYRGDLNATNILTVSEDDGGSQLNWETRYDLPDTALSRIGAPILRSYNEREVEACVKNIKQIIESGWEQDWHGPGEE